MRLEDALKHVIPFGGKSGLTVGYVAKNVPGGIADLAQIAESQKINGDTREALRSFFAAPKMIPYLQRALGKDYLHAKYLLPRGCGGCRCCGQRVRDPETSAEIVTRCPSHGSMVRVQRTYTTVCDCGWREVGSTDQRVKCLDCEEKR